MRRLANGFEQFASRVILGITHDSHTDAEPRSNSAFRHSLRSVIGAFGVNVGSKLSQESFHVWLGKEHDIINATQRANQLRPSAFIEDRPPGAFQVAYAGIRVHADNENVDSSVCNLKGPGRPILDESARGLSSCIRWNPRSRRQRERRLLAGRPRGNERAPRAAYRSSHWPGRRAVPDACVLQVSDEAHRERRSWKWPHA